MRPIKLYWSGRKSANFGDFLSPLIVEFVSGRRVIFSSAKRCDIIAIGSIVQKVLGGQWERLIRGRYSPVKVWGAGSLSAAGLSPPKHAEFFAVRGALTRDALQLAADMPLGDPGLLLNRMIDGRRLEKRYRWGFVPHMADLGDPLAKAIIQQNAGVELIDVTDPDPLQVGRKIAACDFIISSSLHGLIVADCFGVPNLKIRISERVIGGDWKFADYASSVGRSKFDAVTPEDALNLRQLEPRASCAAPSAVADASDKLEHAFREMALA